MEFSRLEYWSGYSFPSPGDLPKPGIELRSPALQANSLPAEPQGKPRVSKWEAKWKDSKDIRSSGGNADRQKRPGAADRLPGLGLLLGARPVSSCLSYRCNLAPDNDQGECPLPAGEQAVQAIAWTKCKTVFLGTEPKECSARTQESCYETWDRLINH